MAPVAWTLRSGVVGIVPARQHKRPQVSAWAIPSDLAGPSRPGFSRPPSNGPPPSAPPRGPPPGPPPGASDSAPFDRSEPAAPRPQGMSGRGAFASRGGRFGGPGRASGYGRGSPDQGRGRGRFEEPDKDDIIINNAIPYSQVRVLDRMKEMLGIMSLQEAMALADDVESDVILLNANAEPPLVRICSLSKYRYEQEKMKKDQSKKQREAQQVLKELKFSPRTDVHDFEVKVRQAHNFLSKGDKVKVVVQFKGRELAGLQDTASEMVQNMITQLEPVATVESAPRLAGNTMFVMLTPKK